MPEYHATLTLAVADTNYRLSALGAPPTMAFDHLSITGYQGPGGTGSNTAEVLVGDSLLSATNFGYRPLAAGDEVVIPKPAPHAKVDITSIYLRSAGTDQKVNISGRY